MPVETRFVDELPKLIADLKAMSPQLKKDFDKGLRKAVEPMQKVARSFVPDSVTHNGKPIWRDQPPTYQSPAWIEDTTHRARDVEERWVWQAAQVRKDIVIRRKSSRRVPVGYDKVAVSVLSLINMSAPGAMYELAGSGRRRSTSSRSRNPYARDDFRSFIVRTQGAPKRLIYKAEAQTGDSVMRELDKVVEERLLKFVRS